MTDTDNTRDIVTRFYEHMAAGNFTEVLASFHDEAEIHEPECLPYGGVYRGIEGVKQLFSRAAQYIDTRVFSVEVVCAQGERAVTVLHTATRGQRVPVTVAEQVELRDGKLWRVRVFLFDPTVVIQAAAERSKPPAG